MNQKHCQLELPISLDRPFRNAPARPVLREMRALTRRLGDLGKIVFWAYRADSLNGPHSRRATQRSDDPVRPAIIHVHKRTEQSMLSNRRRAAAWVKKHLRSVTDMSPNVVLRVEQLEERENPAPVAASADWQT